MTDGQDLIHSPAREALEEGIRSLPPDKQKIFLRRLEEEGPTQGLANTVADALDQEADRLDREGRTLEIKAQVYGKLGDWVGRLGPNDWRMATLERQRVQGEITEDEYRRKLAALEENVSSS